MIPLRAGPLTLHYENGFLRYILYGKNEVIRMIYFALRDDSWATFEPIIETEKIVTGEDSFQIEYTCSHKRNNETIFIWQVRLEGKQNGSIIFEINGEALTDVIKNRAGFCVLHPITELPGEPVEITHPNNSKTQGKFPVFISPTNPFKDIRSMKWRCADEWFSLDFEGDVFETEDQRNWTDASYKTFCTPLSLPFPVKLEKGSKVHQRILFSPDSPLPTVTAPDEEIIHITSDNLNFPIPRIGIGASEAQPLTTAVIEAIKKLELSHYRIDVHPSVANWIPEFSARCVEAVTLQLDLEIVLHLSLNFKEEIEQFTGLCLQNRLKVTHLLLLEDGALTTPQHIVDSVKKIKEVLSGTQIGAGTDFNFTELNQNRFNANGIDFVSYSIHPQEHAFDNKSIIETLESQTQTASNAGMIYRNIPVHVSPITLKKRFNPSSKDPAKKIQSEEQRTDPRQSTPFCAVWTLGSIKHFTEGEASSLTYFQTQGKQGIVNENCDQYPVYNALTTLSELPHEIIKTQSSAPLIVEAMLFANGDLLVWNYSETKRIVCFNDLKFDLMPFEIKAITNDNILSD